MTDFFESASAGPIQGDRFGSAAKDYADHRKGFPDTTFDELLKLGVGESGQSLLDLGRDKASKVADEYIKKIRDAMGLNYLNV